MWVSVCVCVCLCVMLNLLIGLCCLCFLLPVQSVCLSVSLTQPHIIYNFNAQLLIVFQQYFLSPGNELKWKRRTSRKCHMVECAGDARRHILFAMHPPFPSLLRSSGTFALPALPYLARRLSAIILNRLFIYAAPEKATHTLGKTLTTHSHTHTLVHKR